MADFIPSSDKDLVDLLQNLGVRLAGVVATFGLTAADATAVTTDATNLRAMVLDQEDKDNAAKAATASKNATRAAVVKRARVLARRLKSHPSYTPALGEQLGIMAPGGGGASSMTLMGAAVGDLRPELCSGVGARGEILVGFTKRKHTGVLLYGRRADEREWTLLSKQLRSPFVDQRPNLVSTAPETREYRAVYIDGDQAVGQLSDTLNVTAPGISFTPLTGGKPPHPPVAVTPSTTA